MWHMTYFIQCLDEAGSEDGEDNTGEELQNETVQPHVEGEE